MSTQTETLLMSDDTTTQPPVIIKSGGGGGGPNTIKVEFDGNGNIFDCPRQPQEWQFSTTSEPARITRLEILDGERSWGTNEYNSYLSRPDVRRNKKQLDELLPGANN